MIDTHVLVSGLINIHHAPGRIVDAIRAMQLHLVVDDRILDEYRSVLLGKRLRKWIGEQEARDLLSFLFNDSECVVVTSAVDGLPDPGDIPFLEVAITAGVPLVTGNLKHFPHEHCRGHRIVSPSEFLTGCSEKMR